MIASSKKKRLLSKYAFFQNCLGNGILDQVGALRQSKGIHKDPLLLLLRHQILIAVVSNSHQLVNKYCYCDCLREWRLCHWMVPYRLSYDWHDTSRKVALPWLENFQNSTEREHMLVQSKIKLFIFITKIFIITGTINREYLVVKIFSDSLAYAKLKCTKIHMQYYNAVEGCLSENYLTLKIIAQNILDTKYSFMVLPQNPAITPRLCAC